LVSIAAVLLAVCLAAGCGAENAAELEQAQKELAEVREKRDELEARVAALEEQNEQLRSSADNCTGWHSLSEQERFEYQCRMELLKQSDTPFAHRPGTTSWQSLELGDLDEVHRPTPGELLFTIMGGTEQRIPPPHWLGQGLDEVKVRLRQTAPDRAEGLVLYWGFRDDSIIGRDLKLVMKKHNDRWSITTLAERYHCQRGVSDEDRCL
jgi:cell division protein FtsB